MWNTPQGGVAVLVSEGLTPELVRLPRKRESDPRVWAMWHSTRWVHVRVALGDGATVLHAVSVYGVVGDRESNSALWEDVLHHLSGLRNAPHIVGADCNFPLGRLRDVPQAMLAHLLTRRLVDLDPEYADSEELCQCGYTLGEEVAATCIDPSPDASALSGCTALGGGARAARPMSDVSSAISRVLTASRAPPGSPLPRCATRERDKEEG